MPRRVFSACSPSQLTATLLRMYFCTSWLLPLPCRHPHGGFLPVVGGFSSWRSLYMSCGSLVAFAFVASPAGHSRGDPGPPLGLILTFS